jgi:hypothetical protein
LPVLAATQKPPAFKLQLGSSKHCTFARLTHAIRATATIIIKLTSRIVITSPGVRVVENLTYAKRERSYVGYVTPLLRRWVLDLPGRASKAR